MFGKLYTAALLAAVILTAVTRAEEAVEYSPWCSCKVSVQFTVLLPRRFPCKRFHQKHQNKRLHLVLLLLLAGDVELNPGPDVPINIPHSDSRDNTVKMRSTDDMTGDRCALCNKAPESLMLRSRLITDTVSKCTITDCTSVAHDRCIARERDDHVTEWICAKHFNGAENHEQTSPLRRSPGIDKSDTAVKSPDTEVGLTYQAEDIKRSPHRATSTCRDDVIIQPPSGEPEPVPGPSFMSVSLMDIMEAIRLTQLKLDQVSKDIAHLKQTFQAVWPQDDGRPPASSPSPPSPAARDGSAPDDRPSRLERPRRRNDTDRITCSNPLGKPDLLIIGDSNVRRLETSAGPSRVSFCSTPGATIEQLERELRDQPDKFTGSTIALHVGTNDLSRKGSEEIVVNTAKLAQLAKSCSGAKRVLICSVTPRRDLGSFIFSRSESVNNRLRSLCTNMPGVGFIDLRDQLDRCPFAGLARDALHYNKAGASRVLKGIVHSALAGSFLT